MPPRDPPREFRFRSLPTRLHQKFTCYPPNCFRCDLFVTPPFGEFLVFLVDQICKRPQIPERRRYHFKPHLNPIFSVDATKLPCRQSKILVQKPETLFYAKPLLVDRLRFLRKRLITYRLSVNKDHPQRALEPRLAVGLILDHSVKLKRRILALPHGHIVSTSAIKPFIPF